MGYHLEGGGMEQGNPGEKKKIESGLETLKMPLTSKMGRLGSESSEGQHQMSVFHHYRICHSWLADVECSFSKYIK